MADSTTTTTTTAANNTTTTTTTVDAGQAAAPKAERKGEVKIDQKAKAQHLQEQSAEERMEAAKHEAMTNHAVEHANDDADYDTTTSRDKVEE